MEGGEGSGGRGPSAWAGSGPGGGGGGSIASGWVDGCRGVKRWAGTTCVRVARGAAVDQWRRRSGVECQSACSPATGGPPSSIGGQGWACGKKGHGCHKLMRQGKAVALSLALLLVPVPAGQGRLLGGCSRESRPPIHLTQSVGGAGGWASSPRIASERASLHFVPWWQKQAAADQKGIKEKVTLAFFLMGLFNFFCMHAAIQNGWDRDQGARGGGFCYLTTCSFAFLPFP